MDRNFGQPGNRPLKRGARAALGLAAACLLAGCADVGSSMSDVGAGISEFGTSVHAPRIDLVAENKVVAQSVSGPGIVVSLPSVFSRRNDLEVFGTVTRRPDNDGPIGGFLDVQIRAKTGELIDQSLIHWVPEAIPTDDTRSAKYSAHILGVPPVGSIVRVAYVEKVADLDDPIGPPENGGVGSGAGRGGGGAHGSYGSGGGFGGGFGRR